VDEKLKADGIGGAVLWFIKERIAPINATILFSGLVSGVVDVLSHNASVWLGGVASVLLLAAIFLASLPYMPEGFRQAVRQRFPADTRGSGQRTFRAVVTYLLLGSLVFGGAAVASEKNRQKGGAVAATFPSIATLQQKLDLLHKDNEATLGALTTLKRETSDDPRKELVNQGMLWNKGSFQQALADADVPSARLFLRGGMRMDAGDAELVFLSNDAALQMLVAGYPELFRNTECVRLFSRLRSNDILNAGPPQRGLIHAFCANQRTREATQEQLVAYDAQVQAQKRDQAQLENWSLHPEQCVKDFLDGNGPTLSTLDSGKLYLYKRDGRSDLIGQLARGRCENIAADLRVPATSTTEQDLKATQTLLSWIK